MSTTQAELHKSLIRYVAQRVSAIGFELFNCHEDVCEVFNNWHGDGTIVVTFDDCSSLTVTDDNGNITVN